jgi:hypothetical protein
LRDLRTGSPGGCSDEAATAGLEIGAWKYVLVLVEYIVQIMK